MTDAALKPSSPRHDLDCPVLSLCMIVRDSGRTLGACLASIQPWVDEIVVVDTGSQDETPEIARRYGARLIEFAWCDDFSAARNESIRHAHGKWLFWMDSDDTISPECGRRLQGLAHGRHEPATLGYVMQVHCPSGDGESDVTIVDHIKLFRNLPELRFEGRIHEQILPAIRRLDGDVAWSDIFVTHSGSDQSPAGRLRKYERDLRILLLDLEERPNHPFVLFNLGMTHADQGNHAEAASFLEQCLAVSGPAESHVRKAYALLVQCYVALNRVSDAWTLCDAGRGLFPSDPELLFRHAMLAHSAGWLEEAATSYRSILAPSEDRHFTSIDSGIVGYKARHNLAIVYTDMGRPDLAETQWRWLLADEPQYLAGKRGLVQSLIQQRRHLTAELAISQYSWPEAAQADKCLLQADIAEAKANYSEARQLLEAAIKTFPENLFVLEHWCQFLFERGELSDAERALQGLVERRPDHGAGHYNLGLLYMRRGKYDDAVTLFQRSLELRPESSKTQHALTHAMSLLTSDGPASCANGVPFTPHRADVAY